MWRLRNSTWRGAHNAPHCGTRTVLVENPTSSRAARRVTWGPQSGCRAKLVRIRQNNHHYLHTDYIQRQPQRGIRRFFFTASESHRKPRKPSGLEISHSTSHCPRVVRDITRKPDGMVAILQDLTPLAHSIGSLAGSDDPCAGICAPVYHRVEGQSVPSEWEVECDIARPDPILPSRWTKRSVVVGSGMRYYKT